MSAPGRSQALIPAAATTVLAALALLAGCTKSEAPTPGAASAASSTAAASASAPASGASAAGPILPPETVQRPTEQQRAAGEALARQGGGAQIAACSGCHGTTGEGNGAAGFPRLAGQSYAYLLHALTSFANDSRVNPVMQPIAKAMSVDQRQAAAAYYAALSPAGTAASGPVASPPGAAGTGDAQRGRTLAEVGDESHGVQACANCHGPGGRGGPGAIPYLAGQHAGFLVASLKAWRDGSRTSDPAALMPLVAKALDERDSQAVATWFAQATPPDRPRDQDVAAPVGGAASASASVSASSSGTSASASASASGPGAARVVSGPRSAPVGNAGASPQGVGTEQGSPVTGGSQSNGPATAQGASGPGH